MKKPGPITKRSQAVRLAAAAFDQNHDATMLAVLLDAKRRPLEARLIGEPELEARRFFQAIMENPGTSFFVACRPGKEGSAFVERFQLLGQVFRIPCRYAIKVRP